jgi:hypothetical protein
MEKPVPPYPLAIAGEEEEINLQHQETWNRKTLTLTTRSTRKHIENDGSPLPLASSEMPEGKGGGPAVEEGEGGSGGS